MLTEELPKPIRFEWDEGNKTKSFLKHAITNDEAEEVFVNLNFVQKDEKHSNIEERFNILGVSHDGKIIFSVFTARGGKVRIISSRPASQKERNAYEKTAKKNT